MSKFIRNSSQLGQSTNLRDVKEGSDSVVFLDEENQVAHAFYKGYVESNRRRGLTTENHFNRLKKIKQIYYLQKIFNLLYPEVFPVWKVAGINTLGEIGSQREMIFGRAFSGIKVPNEHRIKELAKKLRAKGIHFHEDFHGLNYIKNKEGLYKYVDEISMEILSSETVSKLITFVEEEFSDRVDLQMILDKINKYGRRILEIQKQRLVVRENKVMLG